MHSRLTSLMIATSRILIVLASVSLTLFAQAGNPVIIIPGLSGSELRHKDTGERIWFKALKQRSEDLRLPISEDLSGNHDNLVPGDILRTLKLGVIPLSDVYGGLIETLERRGGYHEEKWETPSEKAAQKAIYVFPYDWRLDNVENARSLVKKVEKLKARLKRPDLKFDIVSHSMGGIIARYAAMYGDADLPVGATQPRPTWVGAKHFDKIIMMGTPNEGSALALNTLLNGFLINGVRVDLPFFQDSSKFTAFTMPAVFQLLPAPGTLRAYNDRLKPVEIDIYDPKTWKEYGWSVTDDRSFARKFSKEEQKAADKYFAAVLERARRLHEALAVTSADTGGVSFYGFGSECKRSSDALLVYRDRKSGNWKTIFDPESFTRADGSTVKESELKKLMMTSGDGIVTRRSFESGARIKFKEPGTFVCEEHIKLPRNRQIQQHILAVLSGTPARRTLAAIR